METQPKQVTFVVRMWQLDEARTEHRWRGSVRELESGRQFFVSGTRDVGDFIAAFLAESTGTP